MYTQIHRNTNIYIDIKHNYIKEKATQLYLKANISVHA